MKRKEKRKKGVGFVEWVKSCVSRVLTRTSDKTLCRRCVVHGCSGRRRCGSRTEDRDRCSSRGTRRRLGGSWGRRQAPTSWCRRSRRRRSRRRPRRWLPWLSRRARGWRGRSRGPLSGHRCVWANVASTTGRLLPGRCHPFSTTTFHLFDARSCALAMSLDPTTETKSCRDLTRATPGSRAG